MNDGQLEKQGTGNGTGTGTETGTGTTRVGCYTVTCLFHFASNHQTEASDSVVYRTGIFGLAGSR